ncbi:hypothetical protein QR680_014700 [Steinernema hermaphroditum]|uniref:Uncharacterized protein n=1 Tax=Steinernema hermaphroditum TaxID=289476 RepID=A0AA39M4Q9_9BILA|nr:hypothetical protein QR680_014700 [Steinernema hermaphroditum]
MKAELIHKVLKYTCKLSDESMRITTMFGQYVDIVKRKLNCNYGNECHSEDRKGKEPQEFGCHGRGKCLAYTCIC